jgi:dTDP-4-amino-4,6-dideoxygalactose transaminase
MLGHPRLASPARPVMPNAPTPIYVTQPHLPPLDDFVPLLREIWDSKVLTNGGPFHQRLEAALAEHLGVGHMALFANATLALVTALQALRITGEVITTPYSFVATAHSLLWNGIKPVFVDIDPVTLNLDPAKVEAAITPQTTAILPVHCYGRPCDTAALQRIADTYGLKLIYDAAHAFGVRDTGGSVLRHGDLSVLSFHATKVFNTFEGGAIVCPDAKAKTRIDHLKNFGFVDEVTVVAPGINGKMNEFQAALGLMQLRDIDLQLDRRALIDAHYRDALAGVPGIRCVERDPRARNNHAYFAILVGPEFPLTRDALYERLKSQGIHGRRYFHPLITQFPMYRGLPSAAPANLPVATRIAQQVICLPIYPALTLDDVDRIAGIVRDAAVPRSHACPSTPTPSYANSGWSTAEWASSSPGALPCTASPASAWATTAASTTSA